MILVLQMMNEHFLLMFIKEEIEQVTILEVYYDGMLEEEG
jgi:hypothetical protein